MASQPAEAKAQGVDEFPDYNVNPVTLAQFIMKDDSVWREKYGRTRTSLAIILQAISVAAKVIANAVQKAGMQGLFALRGTGNIQGEDQKKLDVLANDVFCNVLRNTKKVAVMVSEEIDEPIVVEGLDHARYSVVFDPLDGSSNIECNVSVGTIFGIYHNPEAKSASLADALQPGRELVAAGYVLYSSAVVMVFSIGDGVHAFTLDPNFGEFVMTGHNLRIPDAAKRIYSVNTGNSLLWDEPTKAFIRWTKNQKEMYSGRYIGSMVSDVHRTLLYGGIFMYPADSKSKSGKLRLLYECNPMAFLIEQAGGMATDGKRRILDIQPEKYHQRSPIFLGCERDVKQIIKLYEEHEKGTLPENTDELLV